MFRKILLTSVMIMGAVQAYAQLTPDYTHNALLLSSQYYDGTARSLAMGNAMTALGGDLGALSYNPAASGVYRYYEFTLTPSVYSSLSHSAFLDNVSSTGKSRFALSNVGWAGTFETGRTRGLLNFNLAITANQTNNFAYRSSGSGIQKSSSYLGYLAATMPDIPGSQLSMQDDYDDRPFYRDASWSQVLAWNTGMIDTLVGLPSTYIGATENISADGFFVPGNLVQDYYREKTGYIQDIVINASGNVDNIFFFGVSVTLQSIWMNEYTYIMERAADPSVFKTGFTDFTREYQLTTSGVGVDISAGFLVRPVAGLTIGGSVSTPDWMFLNEGWMETMSGYTAVYGHSTVNSPLGSYSYRITAPFKWNLGVGYTLGTLMAIGVDYERVDYSTITMASSGGNRSEFQYENDFISKSFQAVNNVRAGLEIWPHSQLAVRLGYNYYSSSEKDYDNSRHYASAGLGYRNTRGFFLDLAYQQQCNFNNNEFALYGSYEGLTAPIASENSLNWKILLTLGWRF